MIVCALRLYPATPGWGVWWGFVCLGSVFGCASPLLAGVLGPVCACVRAPLVRRDPWLGCAVWVCVLGLAFWLRPATPGWNVRASLCLCPRSTCTPPLLAGLCCVCVCAWGRVRAATHHSWLGCWSLCVLVCVLPLYPATPGGLCGVSVCAWARVSVAPRHSWLGCLAWVYVLGLGSRLQPASRGWGVGLCVCLCICSACTPPLLAWVCGLVGVLGPGLQLRPATPGCGVGVCVCLCARSARTPPLLAGKWGVGLCAWARVSAAPRNSWQGCWCVCVLVCAVRSYPTLPGWGVRCGCVSFGSGSSCAPPLLARVWGVCALVCVLRLYPATPGRGVQRGCVCSGLGFGCTQPLLAGVLGSVCVRVRTALVPRHSWLGCVVGLCVFGLGFRLRPASPGWGVGVCICVSALRFYPASPCWGVRCVCVCLGSAFGCAPPFLVRVLGCACASSACAPPLPAEVCCVVGCALAQISAAPRHSWLGCLGLCVCVRALLL